MLEFETEYSQRYHGMVEYKITVLEVLEKGAEIWGKIYQARMTLYNMLEYAKEIKCYIGILVKGQVL